MLEVAALWLITLHAVRCTTQLPCIVCAVFVYLLRHTEFGPEFLPVGVSVASSQGRKLATWQIVALSMFWWGFALWMYMFVVLMIPGQVRPFAREPWPVARSHSTNLALFLKQLFKVSTVSASCCSCR